MLFLPTVPGSRFLQSQRRQAGQFFRRIIGICGLGLGSQSRALATRNYSTRRDGKFLRNWTCLTNAGPVSFTTVQSTFI